MSQKYPEYKGLNLPNVAEKVLQNWNQNQVFQKSIDTREGNPPFIFTEGPPSANGMPGIHHVMARSIKDIFCRYKTLQGFQVKRKAGWDTHGLPVELKVEKELGITKEDIGTKISVEDYNRACRESVMRYTDEWSKLTEKMGYWVNMDDPYITYESKYMESVWWILGQIYKKDLMYKGYTVQPYSPKAGTGLSSHEINQPGAYRDVKDTTCVAQFRVSNGQSLPFEAANLPETYFLAWTTTPWTLPSNTALTVGPKIDYVLVRSWNQYTFDPIDVILAKNLVGKQFKQKYAEVESKEDLVYSKGDKKIPYLVLDECKGSDLIDIKYDQLLDYCKPFENAEEAFRIISGDFVTTEDGTGIVHTAPTFGADDAMVAKAAGVPGMLILDENDIPVPLVDLQGRFRKEVADPIFGFAGEYVKAEYLEEGEEAIELEKQRKNLKAIIADLKEYMSVDERSTLKLKIENKAFQIEKYEHSYPHCWRTDKPILYYPLDSWFIKVSNQRERLVELNKTINWQPKATGEGRFGNWLATANDWNLSRSRYWGIPIPVWTSEDKTEQICISSIEELKNEAEKAVQAGLMDKNPLADFVVGDMSKANYDQVDLHKNYVDEITLVSPTGQALKREADVIDVWFDSGSVPYAQHHYPFENKALIDDRKGFPSDFIAEGVDQTRGWFYTQHVIAALVFDSVAYKNVMSNGLVQDKNGQKMAKSKGNAVEPFSTLAKYGPDATRWYMVTNAQPWDNLKFDFDGITEVQRKFFGTLYNTYSFFALYANIDNFNFCEAQVPQNEHAEIDRWILSKLNTLIKEVESAYDAYEPTKAGRLIQSFVNDELSNWYVRLCRRRFWKGDYTQDKISAYQTLYRCLEAVAILGSPIAPFIMDQLFQDLNGVSGRHNAESVHLTNYPAVVSSEIDVDLEKKMGIAQKISSMVLGLRQGAQIKVRQPLQKIMVPILDENFARRISDIQDIILSETNVKEIELLDDTEGVLVKKIKPNFKSIGPKYGKQMKAIAAMVADWSSVQITLIEINNGWKGELNGDEIVLDREDFDIVTDDIPGWSVASEGQITVALDVTLNAELKSEGIARELISRIQNFRKESGLEVMDRIELTIDANEIVQYAIEANQEYIKTEVLAEGITFQSLNTEKVLLADLDEGDTFVQLTKV